MGSGDHIVCSSGILESILWIPPKCTLYIISFSPNCSTSNRKAYGSIPTKQTNSHSWDTMVLFIEPRALQPEGACSYNHICQFRFQHGLCSEHYYHCQGFLSPGNSSSGSHLVNSNHSGEILFCVNPELDTITYYFPFVLMFLLHRKHAHKALAAEKYIYVAIIKESSVMEMHRFITSVVSPYD
jgi:hypothetical protein